MILALDAGRGTPAEQVHDQIRGLITAGALAAGERLPSVRQLAGDLRVAPGTIAKAYKQLEDEQLVETRIGSGTRVSRHASAISSTVSQATRHLVETAKRDNLELDDVLQVIRATW